MNSAAAIMFKKLKLIDEQEIQRLVEKQLRDYDPVIRTLGKLQTEMDSVLNRTDLSPEEKQALYQANLCKFLSMKNLDTKSNSLAKSTAIPPTDATKFLPGAAATSLRPLVNPDSVSDMSIFDTALNEAPAAAANAEFAPVNPVPSVFSNSAKDLSDEYPKSLSIDFNKIKGLKRHMSDKVNNIKDLIESNPNRIGVQNETGEIILDGKAIEKSSFYDLIKSLFVEDNKANLNGSRKFIDTLASMINSNSKNNIKDFCSRRETKRLLEESGSTTSTSIQKGTGHFESRKRKKYLNPTPPRFGSPPGKAIKVLYLY